MAAGPGLGAWQADSVEATRALRAQDETPAAAAKANVAAAVEEDDEDSSDEDDDEVRGDVPAVLRGVCMDGLICLTRSRVGADAGRGCGLHVPGAHGAC